MDVFAPCGNDDYFAYASKSLVPQQIRRIILERAFYYLLPSCAVASVDFVVIFVVVAAAAVVVAVAVISVLAFPRSIFHRLSSSAICVFYLGAEQAPVANCIHSKGARIYATCHVSIEENGAQTIQYIRINTQQAEKSRSIEYTNHSLWLWSIDKEICTSTN